MTDLIEDVQSSIPNIAVNFSDWAGAVKHARNVLAHEGIETNSESADQFVDLLIALSYSIAWVLRTVLLKRGGLRCFHPSSGVSQFVCLQPPHHEHQISAGRQSLRGQQKPLNGALVPRLQTDRLDVVLIETMRPRPLAP
jgi:hypothetical protein